MRFIQTIFTLALVGSAAMSVAASPVVNDGAEADSVDALNKWLATTDAEITYVYDKSVLPAEYARGDSNMNITTTSPALLSVVAPFATRVVYCSIATGPVCGGPCTVYNGGATCLNAPDTNCLFATSNVAFCDRGGCGGSCNFFNSCGTRMDGGFCYTPGTRSINVPFT